MIHKDEYLDWLKHPVTEVFFKEVAEIYEGYKDSLENGEELTSHALTAKKVGLVQAYRSIKDYKPNFNLEGYMIDDMGDIVE